MNDATTQAKANKGRVALQSGVMETIPADLHAALFWLQKLSALFAGWVILGCGSGKLRGISDHQRFHQQARNAQHFLCTRGIPMIDCPRYHGLVKRDLLQFDGSPANRYALGAYVRTTVCSCWGRSPGRRGFFANAA